MFTASCCHYNFKFAFTLLTLHSHDHSHFRFHVSSLLTLFISNVHVCLTFQFQLLFFSSVFSGMCHHNRDINQPFNHSLFGIAYLITVLKSIGAKTRTPTSARRFTLLGGRQPRLKRMRRGGRELDLGVKRTRQTASVYTAPIGSTERIATNSFILMHLNPEMIPIIIWQFLICCIYLQALQFICNLYNIYIV